MKNEIRLRNGMSDENFNLFSYPDGQHYIRIHEEKLNIKWPVNIICNVCNFSELEKLILLATTLRRMGFYIEDITFLYLFGMRSDRAFKTNGENYFKDVIAPIINSLKIPKVFLFCPHSILGVSAIDNLHYRHIGCLIEEEISMHILLGDQSTNFIWRCGVIPNHGDGFLDVFTKTRRKKISVELSDSSIKKLKDQSQKPILIVDDLCDGGGTFMVEAEFLRGKGVTNDLCLFVAHGLFSKGCEVLYDFFKKVYTTDSCFDPRGMKYERLIVRKLWGDSRD